MFIRTENANPAPIVREFETYTSAVTAGGGTYDNANIANAVVERTKFMLSQDDFQLGPGEGERILLAVPIAARKSNGITRVLDFGGAAGLHAALSIRAILEIDQRWAIVETPAMVSASSALSTENIRFFETIESAVSWLGEVDLVHCSGTLQYMPDPIVSVNELLLIGAQTLLMQKSALSLGRTIVELESIALGDNGSGRFSESHFDHVTKVPVTYVNQDDFVTNLCNGYELAFAFSGHPLKTINDNEIESGSAYLLQQK